MLKKLLALKKRLEVGIYQALAENQTGLDEAEVLTQSLKQSQQSNRQQWGSANTEPQVVARHQTQKGLNFYHQFYLKEKGFQTKLLELEREKDLLKQARLALQAKLKQNHVEQEKLRYLIEQNTE